MQLEYCYRYLYDPVNTCLIFSDLIVQNPTLWNLQINIIEKKNECKKNHKKVTELNTFLGQQSSEWLQLLLKTHHNGRESRSLKSGFAPILTLGFGTSLPIYNNYFLCISKNITAHQYHTMVQNNLSDNTGNELYTTGGEYPLPCRANSVIVRASLLWTI